MNVPGQIAASRKLGLVGCGRIGAPVLAAWQAGQLPGWQITGVLVRRTEADRGALFTADLTTFLASGPDIVVEVAGPPVLATIGEQVLRSANLWTASGAALADEALMQRLETAARETGHRLRILPGAFAGLDGVSASATVPDATLQLQIELLPGPEPAALRFSGTVREAARLFPNAVNVAVAAALAGPGLDATRIEVRHPGPVPRNRLALQAHSAAGSLRVEVQPELGQGVHPVACSVIAALQREMQAVWVG
jgi:aspartate dehydrogenase